MTFSMLARTKAADSIGVSFSPHQLALLCNALYNNQLIEVRNIPADVPGITPALFVDGNLVCCYQRYDEGDANIATATALVQREVDCLKRQVDDFITFADNQTSLRIDPLLLEHLVGTDSQMQSQLVVLDDARDITVGIIYHLDANNHKVLLGCTSASPKALVAKALKVALAEKVPEAA